MEVIPFAGGKDSQAGAAHQQLESTCGIGRSLAQFIVEFAGKKNIPVVAIPGLDQVTGKVLWMEIEGAVGHRGGAITGTKSLTVRGELRDGESIIGSFVVRRQDTAVFKNTCESYLNNAKDIARDVARWLKHPVLKARLGSA